MTNRLQLLRRGTVLALFSLGFSGCASTTLPSKGSAASQNQNHKAQVVALLKAIETGETAPFAVVHPNKYIQHNFAVADGLAGLRAALAALPKNSAKVNTVRVFKDGDFVFTHTEYNFFGPKIGFDIFRFEDGKIVEHWDNLQQTPSQPNPSGRTMVDGPTTASDLDRTGANKVLVAAFVDDILVKGRMDRLAGYFDGDNYRQHNPQIGDGVSGLGAALQAMAKVGITLKYTKVHKVLGEGNFVLTVSEGEFAGKPTSFYDLFRVEHGRIAEHWDTIETIPPRRMEERQRQVLSACGRAVHGPDTRRNWPGSRVRHNFLSSANTTPLPTSRRSMRNSWPSIPPMTNATPRSSSRLQRCSRLHRAG